jgi:hypothetical protein
MGRARRALGATFLATLAASACSFDTFRAAPVRGTLGAEMFGVFCDRLGAQSLQEDLSGASFHDVCHPKAGSSYSDHVDVARLPPLDAQAVNIHTGGVVPIATQRAERAYAIARIETLAKHRADLIAALNATFPDVPVDVKDLRSCSPAGQGSLHTELRNLLSRFTSLYNDGTIPQSTASLSRVVDAFKAATDVQESWVRFNARSGYRPVDVALGVVRPIMAYPRLRDLTNSALNLLSADSDPYNPNPQRDSQGNRIPLPGKAYSRLQQLMTVAQAELTNTSPDPVLPPLASTTDSTGRTGLSRPRTDLELTRTILSATDPTFGSAPSRYLVQRDSNGFARVHLVNDAVPTPFVDANGDKLADLDPMTGVFFTTDGKQAPSPFFAIAAPGSGPFDSFGRALSAGTGPLIYDYIDNSRTYLAALFGHLRGAVHGTSLLDSDPADNHETLMDFLAGVRVLMGPRDGSLATKRTYADGTTLSYDRVHTDSSPLIDLVYAFSQILADPTADDTLNLSSALASTHAYDVARIVGDALFDKGLANKDTAAHIPPTSTLWDELLDVTTKVTQDTSVVNGNRLLEDIALALGQPATLGLGKATGAYMTYRDDVSYDRSDLNGPVVNRTTGDNSLPKTPADRSKPDSGANRSEWQRFVQFIYDTTSVTACNKEGAILHANLGTLGTVDICGSTAGGNYGGLCGSSNDCTCAGQRTFHECEVLKIDNVARFVLDSIVGKANLYFRPGLARLATNVGITEMSSGIGLHLDTNNNPDDTYNDPNDVTQPGFWDKVGSMTIRPKPGFLGRQAFFDLVNDSPTSSGKNYMTNHFLGDLFGPRFAGTSVCPERQLQDPCDPVTPPGTTGAFDTQCGTDKATAGVADDGLVHGLRACQDGDWLVQRDQDSTFITEDFGFLQSLTPLAAAFVDHQREDLFLGLMQVLHKHWQSAVGTADECKLSTDTSGNTTSCSKDGADTYEPLLSQVFSSDTLAAINNFVNVLQGLRIATPSGTKTGLDVLAASMRALVDPLLNKGLTDRRGSHTSLRNDGTTNPQVTPLYLVLETLNGIDAAFVQYAKQNPQDAGRQAQWRRARSQLVDELLSVSGQNTPIQSFTDPSFAKVAPIVLDALRAQLLARCGKQSPGACNWLRVSQDTNVVNLVNEVTATIGGPSFASAMDLLEAIRQNDAGRAETERLLSYLIDPLSPNDALSELLLSQNDLLQVAIDNQNLLVPLYHVLAVATAPSRSDPSGNAQRGVVDATTALLSRVAGKAFDSSGRESCANELDPNGVVFVALGNLVTPMSPAPTSGLQVPNCGPTANAPCRTETPLEVILDTIADVNRASPGATQAPLAADYANVSKELEAFLTDGQHGLVQLYEVVREATVHE